MQEISSFNPLQSVYEARSDVTIVPAYGARAGSAGLLSAEGWERLSHELLGAVAERLPGVDGIYVSLHGAMGAQGELDPEGHLLAEIRRLAGPAVPIVISLDLHGILTDRMLREIDGLAIYHTYPHVDFADTGARAASFLLKLLDGTV